MATPQAASPLPLPLTAAFTVAANTLPTIWLANVFPVATPGSQLWPVIKRNIQRESTRRDTPNCTSVSPRGDESFSLSLVTIACKRSLRELEVEQLLALQGNPTYIPLVVFMCKVLFRERKATRRRDPRQRTALMGFRHPENLYSSSFFQSLNKLGKLVQTIKPGFRLVHGLFFFFFFLAKTRLVRGPSLSLHPSLGLQLFTSSAQVCDSHSLLGEQSMDHPLPGTSLHRL